MSFRLARDVDEETTRVVADTASRKQNQKRISYFYDEQSSGFHYGAGHPMKPQRLALTHELVFQYGLHSRMNLYGLRPATDPELMLFHSREYVDFLKKITPELAEAWPANTLSKFNIGADCPIFDNVIRYGRLYSGGSLDGARQINESQADVVVNWAGGLHHAKKSEASGFCYLNDIVVAILELLRIHPRVMYIDIDVHHGDGVQEAFYATDRVLTLSFHKYGEGFFPGTGNLYELGHGRGKYYSVNVPLHSGIDDAGYHYVFKPIVEAAVYYYRPSVIVLQCGADSLGGDRLGPFNLSVQGHGECVRFVKEFGIPLMVLGGGGYTIRNVSRCWAFETSVLTGLPVPNELPENMRYREFFGPEYKLHLPPPTFKSAQSGEMGNTREYLQKVKSTVLEHLRRLQGAPCVENLYIPRERDFS